jgi:hypothetical protein
MPEGKRKVQGKQRKQRIFYGSISTYGPDIVVNTAKRDCTRKRGIQLPVESILNQFAQISKAKVAAWATFVPIFTPNCDPKFLAEGRSALDILSGKVLST